MKHSGVIWFIVFSIGLAPEIKSKPWLQGDEMENENNNNYNHKIDKLIKLGQAEKMMRKVISPIPSRPTLILYIKNGILKGKRFPFNNHFYVFESSLKEFLENYMERESWK